jgi:hypothetical protein
MPSVPILPRPAILRTGLVCAWLAMMSWLVTAEAFPHLFSQTLHGYRALLGDVLARDEWMRVLVQGAPAGYSHGSVEVSDDNPAEFMRVRHELALDLNLAGTRQPIDTELTANLDAWQKLQTFRFVFVSRDQRLVVDGRRRIGDAFDVTVHTRASRTTQRLRIPDNAILHAGAVESALRKLRPGDSVRIDTFDPLTQSPMPMTVRALRREALRDGPTNVMATVLAASVAGLETLSWVDAAGVTRRAETPFGWTLEACSLAEAFAALRAARSGGPADLFRKLAVTCTPPPVRAVHRARYRLCGVDLDPATLESDRQHAVRRADGTIALEVRSAVEPGTAGSARAAAPGPAALAATATIQTTAPDNAEHARAIVKGLPTPAARARAIHAWVAANLRKEVTLSLPTALDVLRARQGDCNEHAVLAVALARAVGIPAVTKAGLVWNREAFFYHAWPAFFVGTWMETDPTLGDDLAGPTHLAFASGDVADHAAVLRLAGKLRLELEEAE